MEVILAVEVREEKIEEKTLDIVLAVEDMTSFLSLFSSFLDIKIIFFVLFRGLSGFR